MSRYYLSKTTEGSSTYQIEHPIRVAGQFGYLSERGVFPHEDLILRVTMRADLEKTNIGPCNKTHHHTYLTVSTAIMHVITNQKKQNTSTMSIWSVDQNKHTSSLVCLDQARLQTCEPVSIHCSGCAVRVFQKRMQRSAVPPPEASSPCW